jgi:hypothetical protein
MLEQGSVLLNLRKDDVLNSDTLEIFDLSMFLGLRNINMLDTLPGRSNVQQASSGSSLRLRMDCVSVLLRIFVVYQHHAKERVLQALFSANYSCVSYYKQSVRLLYNFDSRY